MFCYMVYVKLWNDIYFISKTNAFKTSEGCEWYLYFQNVNKCINPYFIPCFILKYEMSNQAIVARVLTRKTRDMLTA